MKTDIINLTSNPNVTLTTYLLDSSYEMPHTLKRPAVLLLPGGGYRAHSFAESEPVAMAFLAEGYNVFILRYSINENAEFPNPLRDAEEALELIHENAEKWGIDKSKIIVCGFSAGGHLAAALGTMGRIRPNALILIYPVILENNDKILPYPIPGVDKMIDEKTPPTFIVSTFQDKLVPVENTIRFIDKLYSKGIPFESHIFQVGPHGFSLAKPVTAGYFKNFNNPLLPKWFELCINWLNCVFTNELKEYNIHLPISILWKSEECKNVILSYIPEIKQIEKSPFYEEAMDLPLQVIISHIKKNDAENLMSELNEKLKNIKIS